MRSLLPRCQRRARYYTKMCPWSTKEACRRSRWPCTQWPMLQLVHRSTSGPIDLAGDEPSGVGAYRGNIGHCRRSSARLAGQGALESRISRGPYRHRNITRLKAAKRCEHIISGIVIHCGGYMISFRIKYRAAATRSDWTRSRSGCRRDR